MSDAQILSGLSLEQIEKIVDELGGSKFRAKQIFNWIYNKSVASIDEMTDLKKEFREELKKIATVTDVKIRQKQESSDGTIKYLVEFPDKKCVETVLMRFDNRANLTACVSSQIGCACGCKFCATGKQGFKRNLEVQEIIEQVLTIQRDTGLKVTNIVFMGQGEPLLNLENVLCALEIFNKNFQIGQRRITISTSGIVPSIDKLADLELQSTLAISLHASNSDMRKKIMPIENKYDMKMLKSSLKNYINKTGRRITVEYILIKGINDDFETAKELALYLKDLKCNINLIPYNSVDEEFKKPSKKDVMKFKFLLESTGKKVTVRLERGADIDAACGQLSGKVS